MPYKLFWALYKLGTIYLVKYQKKQLISKFQKDDNLLKLLNNANRGGGVKWPKPNYNNKKINK